MSRFYNDWYFSEKMPYRVEQNGKKVRKTVTKICEIYYEN